MNNEEIKSSKKRKVIGLIFFALISMLVGRNLSFIPKFNFSRSLEQTKLKSSITNVVRDKKGSYSVYYIDLGSGKFFGINEHQIETGASVNKVPIVAAAYYLDKQGKISLDEKVTVTESDRQDYGTGSIRYQKLPQNYSLRNLIKLTLKESDNTAAHVLSVKIGSDRIQELVDNWGMSQTSMANNKTTVYDMSLLFEKIYKKQITDAPNTKEFLEFMTGTEFEDRLPKSLPSNVAVFHKTGDGEGFVHDVGIVEVKGKAYYLGVMTSDIGDNLDQTKNTIAEISKKVFDQLSY